jgi:uncharacterized protein YecE (DUF72 family)
MTADLRIGTSGWRYTGWRGPFYPRELPEQEQLTYLSRQLNSVELNGSFYSLQAPASYRRWYAETPDDFVFSIKGGRFITHMKKLRNVETPLANFLASGVLALEHKLGPILWQFPEQLGFDDRFAAFFELLPRDTRAAARLARRSDSSRVREAITEVHVTRPLRHAVELRNPSCCSPEFMQLLREQDIAWVIADSAGRWPCVDSVTADFVYVRLHGEERLYGGRYSERTLSSWAKRIRAWATGGRDVYVYFDNDAEAHAPRDALRLKNKLGRGVAAAGRASGGPRGSRRASLAKDSAR